MHVHYLHRFVLMQRVQDAVIDGYDRYQQIACSPDKAAQLARQFAARYKTEISKQSRWRRKRSGLACAKFLSLKEATLTEVHALLMVTSEGAGSVQNEPLNDPAKRRIQLWGYELVHDGVGWSWRYTADSMKQWRTRIHKAIAVDNQAQLLTIVRSLFRSAGFRLVRKQIGELVNYLRGEWRRLRKGELPAIPTFLPYIKRLPDDWLPVPRATGMEQP